MKNYQVLTKVSLALFVATTLCLAGKTLQLINYYYSRPWFTGAEWTELFRYPVWAKCTFTVQIISLTALIITIRIRKRSSL